MSKRLRFIISSVVLSLGLIGIQFLEDKFKFSAIGILVFLTGVFSAWSFSEALGKNMVWVSLILPMLFTLGVGIFWFLLPSSVYTLIPIVLFYSFGIYILSSTMNIYTVASVKTIALLRAARGVGFVLTLVTSFLIFDAILSLRQTLYVSAPLTFLASFLLFLQGFWSIELEKKFDVEIFKMSLISSVVMLEIAAIIFFWPVTVVVGSLFLTSAMYLLLGLGQAKIEDRLFPATVREYLTVGTIILIGMLVATKWG